MALPHHVPLLAAAADGAPHRLMHEYSLGSAVKGAMVGVAGDAWVMAEPLPPARWRAPRPVAAEHRAAVVDALRSETLPWGPTDPYGGGKNLGACARLVLIAEELGEDEVAAARRAALAAHLEAWLEGSNADALRTDATWGGVVPSRGVVDPGADYGAGFYNDHHFHYGYFVYAAAVLAKGDAAWAARWAPAVTHLIRDIANPSDADELYPPMRHKDWFVGHAWAGGLFPSASGRNQESTSEAVNAWYAIALFGEAIGDARLALLGRTLLATEVRAAQTYWQVKEGSEIYPQPFAAHHLACIVWSTKVDYATWFGSNVEYLFGIQMMPVTPVTELLLDEEWLRQSLPAWEAAMRGRAVPEWRGILIMGFALLDPAAAWRAALGLTRWDNGNTRTNELWWIATRAPPCSSERSCGEEGARCADYVSSESRAEGLVGGGGGRADGAVAAAAAGGTVAFLGGAAYVYRAMRREAMELR
jgi:endo-1,3(4)-beta-glucanase